MLLLNIKCLKRKKVEFGVGNARLSEDIEKLDKAHKALESKHSLLTKSHDQLQIQLSKNDKLAKLSSSISNVNDACATNSTSCEASTRKNCAATRRARAVKLKFGNVLILKVWKIGNYWNAKRVYVRKIVQISEKCRVV